MAKITVWYKNGTTNSHKTSGPATKASRDAIRQYLDRVDEVRLYEVEPTHQQEREEWGQQ